MSMLQQMQSELEVAISFLQEQDLLLVSFEKPLDSWFCIDFNNNFVLQINTTAVREREGKEKKERKTN